MKLEALRRTNNTKWVIVPRMVALAAVFAMLVAAYSKLVIEEWPGPMEIPMALPLVVLAACVAILIKGAGAWSLDRKASG